MRFEELTDEEALALACLVKQLVWADREFSSAEETHLREVVAGLGSSRWRAVKQRLKDEVTSREDVDRVVRAVTRPEARVFLHRTLTAIAASDTVADDERAILAWVAAVWELS